jgi:hypothetical protein
MSRNLVELKMYRNRAYIQFTRSHDELMLNRRLVDMKLNGNKDGLNQRKTPGFWNSRINHGFW